MALPEKFAYLPLFPGRVPHFFQIGCCSELRLLTKERGTFSLFTFSSHLEKSLNHYSHWIHKFRGLNVFVGKRWLESKVDRDLTIPCILTQYYFPFPYLLYKLLSTEGGYKKGNWGQVLKAPRLYPVSAFSKLFMAQQWPTHLLSRNCSSVPFTSSCEALEVVSGSHHEWLKVEIEAEKNKLFFSSLNS